MRCFDVVHQPGFEIEMALVALLARYAATKIGAAVVPLLLGDDVFLARPPQQVVVELHEAQRRIHRRRAAGGEKNVIQVAGRQFGEARGELGRRAVGHRPGRDVGQPGDLLRDGARHFLAAVTDVDAPHAGGRVEQAIAVAVVDVDTLAALEQGAPMPAELDDIVPGMDEGVVGPFQGLGGLHGAILDDQ